MVLALVATSSMSATVPAVAAQPQGIVQIVAHQDDDLLFMNPDIATGIKNGYDTTTVYVTAGEGIPGQTPDTEAYAAERQAGARESYAAMAGVADCKLDSAEEEEEEEEGCWDADYPVVSNHIVQRFTLRAAPHIRLVFLNLPENADYRYLDGGALTKLRNNPSLVTDTLDMREQAPPQRYNRGDVVDVLSTLMEWYSTTLVRAQDPAPDLRLRGDHQDHVAAAWFADQAVARYSAAHQRVLLEHYRDYDIQQLPANLMSTQRDEKQRIIVDHYLPHDQQASQDDNFIAWEQRQYSRNPRGTRWMGIDSAGRLHAFAVAGGRLYE
ncbi:MAG TPA: PIG-L family deacetylase, partial [Lentzea sp.]